MRKTLIVGLILAASVATGTTSVSAEPKHDRYDRAYDRARAEEAVANSEAARIYQHDAERRARIAQRYNYGRNVYYGGVPAGGYGPPPASVAYGIQQRIAHLRYGMNLTSNPTVRQGYTTEIFSCEKLLRNWDGHTVYTNP
jgi:hypothetical protein